MPSARRSLVRVSLVVTALCVLALAPPRPAAADTLVFAAASLKNALDEVADSWEAESGSAVTISYAGSSALARQLQRGAPAALFISANGAWMDELEKDGLIDSKTRRDLVSNRLVLVAHGPDAEAVDPVAGFDLAERLGDERLAMALIDSVPAGIYGKAALISLGVWGALAPKVAQADNVRAALALVARGEAPFGVVYATDAMVEPAVSIVWAFPPESHPPIRYPVALTADTEAPGAAAFFAYLTSPAAAATFERHGFGRID